MTEPTRASQTTGPRLAFSRAREQEDLAAADDRVLLAEIQAGSELALGELVERKTRPLVGVAYRILGDLEEAHDVVQMTFLKIWTHRDRYDGRHSPNTWIYRIATNLSIDHLRSRKSRDRVREPFGHHVELRAAGQAERVRATLDQREISRIFTEVALELTDRQRTVFVLRELEGMPTCEVAAIVGCRESTVRNHLFQARRVLKREMSARYPEYVRAFAGREDSGEEGR